MARIHRIASPENDSERKPSPSCRGCFQTITSFITIPGGVTAGGGLPYEYDIAIATDHALWRGGERLPRKNQRRRPPLGLQNGRSVPSPIALANKKTKILAGELRRKMHGKQVWVDTVILLTDERASRQAARPAGPPSSTSTMPEAILRIPTTSPTEPRISKISTTTLRSSSVGTTRPRKRIEIAGLYDVVERISQNEERTIFLGKHRYIKTRPETILKVFHFDMYSSERTKKQEIEEIFHDQMHRGF